MIAENVAALDSRTIAYAEGPVYEKALAEVWGELMAIPLERVEAPTDRVVAPFVLEVLAECREARARAGGEVAGKLAAAIDRLEVLAFALARAQRDFVFAPPRYTGNARKVIGGADAAFAVVEEAAETLVRRGTIARRDLPPMRAADRKERCANILTLVRLLKREWAVGHAGSVVSLELTRAEHTATCLLSVQLGPDGNLAPSPVEVRNRARTAVLVAREALAALAREAATHEPAAACGGTAAARKARAPRQPNV